MEFDESHDCMAKQVSEYLGALSGEGREKAIEEIRNQRFPKSLYLLIIEGFYEACRALS